jgi:hypothetical protein
VLEHGAVFPSLCLRWSFPRRAEGSDCCEQTRWCSKNLLSTAAPAGVATCTWDQFKILITNRFQSANKEKNARDALTKHSQAGKYLKYDEYLERFMELSLELPQMSVFEKNHAFVTGLKPRTQEFLYAAANPYAMDFDELVAQAERIDTAGLASWQSRQQDGFKRQQRQPLPTPSPIHNTPIPMELGSLHFGTMNEELSTIKTSSPSPKNKRLSTSEVEKYKKEGRCFRCHQCGHIAKKCPSFQARQ